MQCVFVKNPCQVWRRIFTCVQRDYMNLIDRLYLAIDRQIQDCTKDSANTKS